MPFSFSWEEQGEYVLSNCVQIPYTSKILLIQIHFQYQSHRIVIIAVHIRWAVISFSCIARSTIAAYHFFISIYRGEKSSQNPWNSNTLEWTTPVEHIHGNWPGKIPEVHRWAYDYSKKVDPEDDSSDYLHGKDWVSQTVPLLPGEEPS